MKRILTLIAVILILSLLFAACSGSKLSGSYRSNDVISQTFTFDGNHVTMSAFGINASGTYEIKGDEILITYSLLGMEYTWRQPFSRSGNSIFIGGTEFVKQ